MDWLVAVVIFLLGMLAGTVVAHQHIIRRYHRDPQSVRDWLERWSRKIHG